MLMMQTNSTEVFSIWNLSLNVYFAIRLTFGQARVFVIRVLLLIEEVNWAENWSIDFQRLSKFILAVDVHHKCRIKLHSNGQYTIPLLRHGALHSRGNMRAFLCCRRGACGFVHGPTRRKGHVTGGANVRCTIIMSRIAKLKPDMCVLIRVCLYLLKKLPKTRTAFNSTEGHRIYFAYVWVEQSVYGRRNTQTFVF